MVESSSYPNVNDSVGTAEPDLESKKLTHEEEESSELLLAKQQKPRTKPKSKKKKKKLVKGLA